MTKKTARNWKPFSGARLWIWVAALGIAPTVLATVFVYSAQMDAGYYMPAEFLRSQRALVLRVALYLGIPAVLLLWAALRRPSGPIPARVPMVGALVAVLAWLSYAAPTLRRDLLEPELSQAEVEAFARAPIDASLYAAGLIGLSLDDRVFTLHLAPANLAPEPIPVASLTPDLCRNFGRLFAGPVDVIRSVLVTPTGAQYIIDLHWYDCRGWYLQDRAIERRPLSRPPSWQLRHFDWPIFAPAQDIEV